MKGIQHSNRKIWDELFSNFISGANSEITIRYGQLKYSYSASYSDECSVCILPMSGWLFRECLLLNTFSLWVGQKIVLAVFTVELKVEWRLQWAIENPQECLFVLCMENAEQVFDLPSCHIWRHVVITGYDDRFREIKNRLIFRLHFLQQFKLGTAFFVRGFGCAFFILIRLRVLFVTALRTIRQFRSTLPLSQQSATASRWIFMRTWQTCRRVQGWYGVWTAADLSLYPPPTAWPAAWNPSPRARRR